MMHLANDSMSVFIKENDRTRELISLLWKEVDDQTKRAVLFGDIDALKKRLDYWEIDLSEDIERLTEKNK